MLTHFEKNAQRVHCLNEQAELAGLLHGMSFADARALYHDLTSDVADPLSDIQFLLVLARWADRYSPIVSTDGPDGLLLDISGVGHLFGGEQELVSDLMARLARANLAARLAVADSVGAAWGVARFGERMHKNYGPRQSGAIIPENELQAALANLSVIALRIDGATSNALRRVGLSTIHDLTQIPRPTLARRFGVSLLTQLDLALGQAMEPISKQKQAVRYIARITLADPIGLFDDVMGIIQKLMVQVCKKLEEAHKGARRLRVTIQRVDSANQQAEIGLARAMRDPVRMVRLLERAVGEFDAGYGIERVWLEAVETETLHLAQRSHVEKKIKESEDLADLVSRIGNRVGFENIIRYLPAQSHIPTKCYIHVGAAYSEPALGWRGGANRPLMVFLPEPIASNGSEPPMRFRWRNMNLSIQYSEGPERIQPEWWLDDPDWRTGMRDYWRVQTHQGRRLWLFYTPQVKQTHISTWFVQGEFA